MPFFEPDHSRVRCINCGQDQTRHGVYGDHCPSYAKAEHAHAATVAQLQALVKQWREQARAVEPAPNASTIGHVFYDFTFLMAASQVEAILTAPSGATETTPQ